MQQRLAAVTNTMATWLLLCVASAYTVDAQAHPSAVIWYAPFLSGGGYCSEAHSYVTSISAALHSIDEEEAAAAIAIYELAQDAVGDVHNHAGSSSQSHGQEQKEAVIVPFSLYVTQHGDSFNAAFIRDIPTEMRELLEEVWLQKPGLLCWIYTLRLSSLVLTACEWLLTVALTASYAIVLPQQHWVEPRDFHWRLRNRKIAIAICHSEPGAWHPAHYSTSRCPPEGAQYTVGRTMFETDRVPSGWADRMNVMDEIWVPTKYA